MLNIAARFVRAVSAAGGRDPDDVAALLHEPLHLLDRRDVLPHLHGPKRGDLASHFSF